MDFGDALNATGSYMASNMRMPNLSGTRSYMNNAYQGAKTNYNNMNNRFGNMYQGAKTNYKNMNSRLGNMYQGARTNSSNMYDRMRGTTGIGGKYTRRNKMRSTRKRNNKKNRTNRRR
jgi:hypothetical protein